MAANEAFRKKFISVKTTTKVLSLKKVLKLKIIYFQVRKEGKPSLVRFITKGIRDQRALHNLRGYG